MISNESEPSGIINSVAGSNDTSSNTSNDLLNLFLRTRTNINAPSLDSSVWDFLTLRDLYQLRSVSKLTFVALGMVEYNRCRDGKGKVIFSTSLVQINYIIPHQFLIFGAPPLTMLYLSRLSRPLSCISRRPRHQLRCKVWRGSVHSSTCLFEGDAQGGK